MKVAERERGESFLPGAVSMKVAEERVQTEREKGKMRVSNFHPLMKRSCLWSFLRAAASSPSDRHLNDVSSCEIQAEEPNPSFPNMSYRLKALSLQPAEVLQADAQLNFPVNKISINRNGSAMLLASSNGLCIMYLYGHTSTKDNTIICRTVSVGSQIYFNSNNVIHTLQVSWHPYSDTHLGILSSDSVFRLFDLSSDIGQSEQEYYLQPMELGRSRNAASICPVDFSFGVDHLWDRFSTDLEELNWMLYVLPLKH